MDQDRPLRIVVLGGGTAGWMAAALMCRRWAGVPIRISVVESPEIGIIGVGEGSTPQLKAFFDLLGITEAEWMPRCQATYKTGIAFRDWSPRAGRREYFHPFPTDLDDRSAPALFFNAYSRRQGFDVDAHPDRFFLNAELARQRLAPLPAHQFPFRIGYGYHFDAQLIGHLLRDWCVARGVQHLQATMTAVERAESGDLRALRTADGARIEGDFFVDSTGFRSLLLQQALGVGFRGFADNLFNDSAVVAPTPADAEGVDCHTTATALSAGWAWRIPLTQRHGNGYVYSSTFISDEAAERELRQHLGIDDAAPPLRRLKMRVGRVEAPWAHNCLAVGLSQGFIEPLEATALHIVQETVDRFIEMFSAGDYTPRLRDAFNQRINARIEGIRDYIVCHYRVSSRDDSEYWRANVSHDRLSDSLRQLLECWFAGEGIEREIQRQDIGKYYSAASWHCLLGGYGVYPDAAALKPPPDKVRRFDLQRIDDFIQRCALNFRPHRQVLDELAAGREPS